MLCSYRQIAAIVQGEIRSLRPRRVGERGVRTRELPNHDALEPGLREVPLEAPEESTLTDARRVLTMALSLVPVASLVAFRVGATVPNVPRADVLGAIPSVVSSGAMYPVPAGGRS